VAEARNFINYDPFADDMSIMVSGMRQWSLLVGRWGFGRRQSWPVWMG